MRESARKLKFDMTMKCYDKMDEFQRKELFLALLRASHDEAVRGIAEIAHKITQIGLTSGKRAL